MARRELTPEEEADRRVLLESSDRELLGNLNYLWRKLNSSAKGKIQKPSQLRDYFDASQVVCVKKGITAGFRRYEVLDSQLGRTVLVFAPNAVWQHGPLRWSIKTNFLWAKAGTNIPARRARGPWQPIQMKMWCESMPTRCHVMEKFIEAFNSRIGGNQLPPIDLDIEGTYAPEKREIRLRRIANLIIEAQVPGDVVETPLDYRRSTTNMARLKTHGFSTESDLIQIAFACSELENTLLRAQELGWAAAEILSADAMKFMLFNMKLREVL